MCCANACSIPEWQLGATAQGKLRELVRNDLSNLASVPAELTGFDACFFCLGVSSVGMAEDEYRRMTYDLTVGVGELLARPIRV